MSDVVLSEEMIEGFHRYLIREEKSAATIEKYERNVRRFFEYCQGRPLSKDLVVDFKAMLICEQYSDAGVNGYLASLNSFFRYSGMEHCRVKNLVIQRHLYRSSDKELSKSEYYALLRKAKNGSRVQLILETICSTGIRVSELQFFTMEAVEEGEVRIRLKGKMRIVLIPDTLRRKLREYGRKNGIKKGVVFTNKAGAPLHRSYIWAIMKRLAQVAGVQSSKVFPHNLRKLFARCFYRLERDVMKLADVLGHESVNTTRVYLMETGIEHRKQLERLNLII